MRSFIHSKISLLILILPLFVLTGCSMSTAEREARMPHGYIWFCDGAGGGGVIGNYARGVVEGMKEANYRGSGEVFKWNTGLGVVADQNSSVDYKRRQGKKLAEEIVKYQSEYPGAPTTVAGLSAGTAVALYALEQLPSGVQVDNVLLLSSSVSSTYDLAPALRHVRGNLYVFTSTNDGVLRYLVPMSGTADRESGSQTTAGIAGFQTPYGASAATRQLYDKVKHIHWDKRFEKDGNYGGHTDVVKAPFVRDYIAPLIMAADYRTAQPTSMTGLVRNPDYDRWAPFKPGAWVRWKGESTYEGKTRDVTITAQLVSRQSNRIVVEWDYSVEGDTLPYRTHEFIEAAWIKPDENPFTNPNATVKTLPSKSIPLKGETLSCMGQSVESASSYGDWGSQLRGTMYKNSEVPGQIVEGVLESVREKGPFSLRVTAVDFGLTPEHH